MTAIKVLIMTLALTLFMGGNQWVTAGEVGHNYENKIVRFYANPGEDLPTEVQIAQFCPPGWSYEVYRWTVTPDGSLVPHDVAQGQCPDVTPPANPYDKFGI